MVGALMEALASNSHYGLRTAYYETTLRTKLAHDPESAEMMDVIIGNIYIDAGILYIKTLNNFHERFHQIIGKGVNSVTSDYKSVVTGLEPNLCFATAGTTSTSKNTPHRALSTMRGGNYYCQSNNGLQNITLILFCGMHK